MVSSERFPIDSMADFPFLSVFQLRVSFKPLSAPVQALSDWYSNLGKLLHCISMRGRGPGESISKR
jgi:hypothetical protein